MQHVQILGYQSDEDTIQGSKAITADGSLNLTTAIASGAVDQHVVFSFLCAKLAAICLMADQNVTVYTNAIHSGAPANTIVLTAGVPYILPISGVTIASVFTVDITTIYVTNNSSPATAATLKIRAAINA